MRVEQSFSAAFDRQLSPRALGREVSEVGVIRGFFQPYGYSDNHSGRTSAKNRLSGMGVVVAFSMAGKILTHQPTKKNHKGSRSR